MAIKIIEPCINCARCEPECPNNAIYTNGDTWSIADGTAVRGDYELMDGTHTDARERHAPIATNIFYIVPDKCTECQGFHEEPQCAAVCPVDCCVPDELYQETIEELLSKKDKLHVK